MVEGSPVFAMCDYCGTRLLRFTRKQCMDCHQYFCSSCVAQSKIMGHIKGLSLCKDCELFASPVMERRQLEGVSVDRLKHYSRSRQVEVPINASKKEIVDIIIGRQAKVLSERARKALQEVQGGSGEDFETVDVNTLEPHTSVYSTGAAELNSRIHPTTTFDPSSVDRLDDIQNECEIQQLGVKQLKIILRRNCIDYKGCVEKHELCERVIRLWHSRQEEKVMEAKIAAMGDSAVEGDFLCKVCMDAPVDCVLLECGHMLTCVKCGRQLAECPICRHYVSRVVHAFKV